MCRAFCEDLSTAASSTSPASDEHFVTRCQVILGDIKVTCFLRLVFSSAESVSEVRVSIDYRKLELCTCYKIISCADVAFFVYLLFANVVKVLLIF